MLSYRNDRHRPCNPQSDLGMRNEYIEMSEFIRRMDREIYDKDEYHKALAWTKEHCIEVPDANPHHLWRTREQKTQVGQTVVNMTLIVRDLMIGNPVRGEMGYGEEALGHHAIAAGFQGQRAWTDHFPNGDFMEAILSSSFDWNGIREAFVMSTENDALNAVTMARINLIKGLGPVLQLAEGYTVELPQTTHDILDKRTNPTWPTKITPFTQNKEVDYPQFAQWIEWYIHRGVHGLFAVCQSSEMFELILEERIRIARFTVE